MTIKKVTYPERVLIVLARNGTLMGAHVEHLELLVDDEEVLSSKQLPASPLDGTELGGIIPLSSAIVSQVSALMHQVETVEKQRDGLTAALKEAEAKAAGLDAALVRVSELEALLTPPATVRADISDRQFFQGLTLRGLITQDEALAAVMTGTLPAQIEAFITQLAADRQFAARMVLSGATSYNLDNPLTAEFGQMAGMDAPALSEFWQFCAKL